MSANLSEKVKTLRAVLKIESWLYSTLVIIVTFIHLLGSKNWEIFVFSTIFIIGIISIILRIVWFLKLGVSCGLSDKIYAQSSQPREYWSRVGYLCFLLLSIIVFSLWTGYAIYERLTT